MRRSGARGFCLKVHGNQWYSCDIESTSSFDVVVEAAQSGRCAPKV